MNEEGRGRSRRKAVASISMALSMVMGALLFAELDASATHEFGVPHVEDLVDVDQVIDLSGGQTSGTALLGQSFDLPGISGDQLILAPLPTNTNTCPNLLLFQALQDSVDITQRIQLAGCPVPSG